MAQITKKTLVLNFGTAVGDSLKLTINAPADNLSAETVSAAMDAKITSEAFGADSLAKVKSEAKYVIQEVEEIALV